MAAQTTFAPLPAASDCRCAGLALSPDGTLICTDPANQQLCRIGDDGTLIERIPVATPNPQVITRVDGGFAYTYTNGMALLGDDDSLKAFPFPTAGGCNVGSFCPISQCGDAICAEEQAADLLARIPLGGGTLFEQILPRSGTAPVAAASDGSEMLLATQSPLLWTTVTGYAAWPFIEVRLGVTHGYRDLAYGFNSFWAIADGRLLQITPGTHDVVNINLPGGETAGAERLAVMPDGRMAVAQLFAKRVVIVDVGNGGGGRGADPPVLAIALLPGEHVITMRSRIRRDKQIVIDATMVDAGGNQTIEEGLLPVPAVTGVDLALSGELRDSGGRSLGPLPHVDPGSTVRVHLDLRLVSGSGGETHVTLAAEPDVNVLTVRGSDGFDCKIRGGTFDCAAFSAPESASIDADVQLVATGRETLTATASVAGETNPGDNIVDLTLLADAAQKGRRRAAGR